jgi:protein-L-isoaspartate O-methyltransferase
MLIGENSRTVSQAVAKKMVEINRTLPAGIEKQLKPGGLLVAPLGKGTQRLKVLRMDKELVETEDAGEVVFVPLLKGEKGDG